MSDKQWIIFSMTMPKYFRYFGHAKNVLSEIRICHCVFLSPNFAAWDGN